MDTSRSGPSSSRIGRNKRQLETASILLELPNEPLGFPGSNPVKLGGPSSSRWLHREQLPPPTAPSETVSYPLRGSRISRGRIDIQAIGTSSTAEGEIIPLVTSHEMVKDNIIMAESSMAPGVPVIYRPPEDRITNPERLNLDRRNLTVCPILESEDMLRLLNLQHNFITHIHHLGSLRRLVFLDLYDNRIEEIGGLDGLHSLRVLMLGRNRIRCIGGLDALVKLDVLDLHGNLIRNITNLSHLIHLRVLNLAGNEITIVENLNGLVSLAELNLRRNKITHCDIGDLSHLQRLFLSHNLIESFDDIVSSVQCSLLSELSIDGNPLANDEDHRSIIISYLKQLNTLNQLHVTEDERKEATLVARQDEIKLNELHKQLKIIEERETLISAVRKEWEINHKTKDHVPINSYIEDEWNVVTLYGTPSLEFFKGKRPLPCVTQLTLNYMNFADVVNALPHMKDTLPSLQHLECHCLNLKTLFDLQTFANNFPPSLITLTMKKDGNPVTGHPYWMEWLESLLPSVIINGRKRNPDQANLFDPISQFFSMSDSINDDLVNNSLSLKQQSQKFACGVQKEALSRYCRKQEFEKVWPEVIKQLVKDAINKQ